MLPKLNENGDLPPGIHPASWLEIRKRFGTGTEARVRGLALLEQIYDLAGRTSALRRFIIFGSFVSAAPEPRDVDVVLVMSSSFRIENCPAEARLLFSHSQAQARHGASVFWFREGAMPEEFLRAWQVKRDGTLRGILELA